MDSAFAKSSDGQPLNTRSLDGDIFMEIGRIILSKNGDILFKAGQGDYSNGDFQVLCAYLADQ